MLLNMWFLRFNVVNSAQSCLRKIHVTEWYLSPCLAELPLYTSTLYVSLLGEEGET